MKLSKLLVLTTTLLSMQVWSASEQIQLASYSHEGGAYPPVFYVSNIEEGEFKTELENYGAFQALDEEAVGLPIGIRVLKGLRMKQDAATFSSLMVSASTLGLVPVVNSKVFKVRYEVFLQGKSIATYEYDMTSTDVDNFWTAGAQNGQRDLKESEKLFLDHSQARFLTDLKSNAEVQEVFTEYFHYFGE